MAKILIVEDEDIIRSSLSRLLTRHKYTVDDASSVEQATEQFQLDQFDLVISDLRLPGAPGTDLISLAGDVPVLIMTSYASVQSAVESMDKGAAFYIAKPFDHEVMLEKVKTLIEENSVVVSNVSELSSSQRGKPQLGSMIGSCKPMLKMYDKIRRVGATEATVLINGETGTGKELVAKSIHEQSRRNGKSLISVNCAAIPETLIESELFGYEKGAFTGANSTRMGLIEAANEGTLFLDEIGELPLEAQARMLRFLQESEIRRIGSVESQKVNVRLVCATHRDLKEMVDAGSFREDLYYRINVVCLELPPLRDRGKDILEIAEAFLKRRCSEIGIPPMHFTPKAIQAISTYVWPGNIRELENAVERAVILSDGPEIDHDVFDIDLQLIDAHQLRHKRLTTTKRLGANKSGNSQANQDAAPQRIESEELSLEDYFQRFVLEHQDSMSETELAQKLGVSRKCLWERRQRLGIPRKKSSARSS